MDQKKFLIPHHLLTNFEIQKYHENEPRFNGVFSRDNFPKTTEDEAYIINLDDHKDVARHLIALFVEILKLFNLKVFDLNMLLKKLKDLLDIKA